MGKGKPLRVAIEKKELFSFILWGPPGCGKTTLARIYANASTRNFTNSPRSIPAKRTSRKSLDAIQSSPKAAQGFPRSSRKSSFYRRDPPFQQSAAGFSLALRRARRHHAHRRDDRKSVVRGHRSRSCRALACLSSTNFRKRNGRGNQTHETKNSQRRARLAGADGRWRRAAGHHARSRPRKNYTAKSPSIH